MILFRNMETGDIPDVLEIERQLFSDPWSEENFMFDLCENERSFSFVAEQNGEVIGYILGWYIEPELHIGNIAVKKSAQSNGVGSFLVSQMLNSVNGYEVVYLEVRESNQIAQKMYQKFGFKSVYSRKSYYNDGENAVIMVKENKS